MRDDVIIGVFVACICTILTDDVPLFHDSFLRRSSSSASPHDTLITTSSDRINLPNHQSHVIQIKSTYLHLPRSTKDCSRALL